MRMSRRPVVAALVLGLTAGGTGIVAAQDAEPSGDVRFLVAENFWADWDPYNHTAQIQRRIEAQIFDFLVDFPDPQARSRADARDRMDAGRRPDMGLHPA